MESTVPFRDEEIHRRREPPVNLDATLKPETDTIFVEIADLLPSAVPYCGRQLPRWKMTCADGSGL
jgi:hypothetical protein